MSDLTDDQFQALHDRLFKSPAPGENDDYARRLLEQLEDQRKTCKPLREADVGLWIDRLVGPEYMAENAEAELEERREHRERDVRETLFGES